MKNILKNIILAKVVLDDLDTVFDVRLVCKEFARLITHDDAVEIVERAIENVKECNSQKLAALRNHKNQTEAKWSFLARWIRSQHRDTIFTTKVIPLAFHLSHHSRKILLGVKVDSCRANRLDERICPWIERYKNDFKQLRKIMIHLERFSLFQRLVYRNVIPDKMIKIILSDNKNRLYKKFIIDTHPNLVYYKWFLRVNNAMYRIWCCNNTNRHYCKQLGLTKYCARCGDYNEEGFEQIAYTKIPELCQVNANDFCPKCIHIHKSAHTLHMVWWPCKRCGDKYEKVFHTKAELDTFEEYVCDTCQFVINRFMEYQLLKK